MSAVMGRLPVDSRWELLVRQRPLLSDSVWMIDTDKVPADLLPEEDSLYADRDNVHIDLEGDYPFGPPTVSPVLEGALRRYWDLASSAPVSPTALVFEPVPSQHPERTEFSLPGLARDKATYGINTNLHIRMMQVAVTWNACWVKGRPQLRYFDADGDMIAVVACTRWEPCSPLDTTS